jgi:hypothetical protein
MDTTIGQIGGVAVVLLPGKDLDAAKQRNSNPPLRRCLRRTPRCSICPAPAGLSKETHNITLGGRVCDYVWPGPAIGVMCSASGSAMCWGIILCQCCRARAPSHKFQRLHLRSFAEASLPMEGLH